MLEAGLATYLPHRKRNRTTSSRPHRHPFRPFLPLAILAENPIHTGISPGLSPVRIFPYPKSLYRKIHR